jgi:hypothetical protein
LTVRATSPQSGLDDVGGRPCPLAPALTIPGAPASVHCRGVRLPGRRDRWPRAARIARHVISQWLRAK